MGRQVPVWLRAGHRVRDAPAGKPRAHVDGSCRQWWSDLMQPCRPLCLIFALSLFLIVGENQRTGREAGAPVSMAPSLHTPHPAPGSRGAQTQLPPPPPGSALRFHEPWCGGDSRVPWTARRSSQSVLKRLSVCVWGVLPCLQNCVSGAWDTAGAALSEAAASLAPVRTELT